MTVMQKLLSFFGFTNATNKPERLDSILHGFETQIEKLSARISEDEAEIARKTAEQERLESEKELLQQDVVRGNNVKSKFIDLIA